MRTRRRTRREGLRAKEMAFGSEGKGMKFCIMSAQPLSTMSSSIGGWLRGKTVRKGGITSSNSHTRSSTPQVVQSTSTTVFGGGVKDASGRTSEFFVSSLLYNFSSYLLNIIQSMDDQCPVCKSDRYLNPKLRLLVSSCYHKMYVISSPNK